MAEKKQKWYVVLKGLKPGVYTSWKETQEQIHGVEGAVFKGFESKKEAEEAFAKKRFPKAATAQVSTRPPQGHFVIVDASSLGVPGPTEYQGFLMPEKQRLFGVHIGLATNNIGEFLGIVHALAMLKQQGHSQLPVYSDSVTAIAWVRNKKVKSNLELDPKTREAWKLVERALVWLHENNYRNPVLKWETELWGENPADYGRK